MIFSLMLKEHKKKPTEGKTICPVQPVGLLKFYSKQIKKGIVVNGSDNNEKNKARNTSHPTS